jgi:hypothetical protein
MHPRFITLHVGFLAAIVCLISIARADAPKAMQSTKPRPRVIATTDGEIDDQCSMVRFLLYANEWDIEGMNFQVSFTRSSSYANRRRISCLELPSPS